jgi:hypothetical protein
MQGIEDLVVGGKERKGEESERERRKRDDSDGFL